MCNHLDGSYEEDRLPPSKRPSNQPGWLLLIHQIPPKPDYLRVKVWRRLQRLGAVAIKNSVYVLPRGEESVEDLQWVAREISSVGGEAAICEARFVEGLTDAQVVSLFHQARNADYGQVAADARRLHGETPASRPSAEADLARLRRRLAEVIAIDHLGAPGRAAAEKRVAALEQRVRFRGAPGAAGGSPGSHVSPSPPATGTASRAGYQGRTWVTRKDIHIDRMASAWLIRRFIDLRARFKFVPASGYLPKSKEIRFDMFEAEFTHQGDRCTFEVLAAQFVPKDSALRPIAEIIHDLDLKDSRYAREEATGIERLVAGVIAAHGDDTRRLARGAALFDDLYASFRGRRR